ncbi:hypothetical protein FA15DRAFT_607570 [Coprinopsis marcescibilis]|uniref:Uncharacterized protein n=1 Tax=Coprinopsis marcescibilis TaxID=230819 RepID=A0A5C3K8B2_COPMA|nr:hypothetical protein FA15DRAFT_607570 [Coprinopsis marcescibilis]
MTILVPEGQPATSNNVQVVFRRFSVSGSRHPHLNMPILIPDLETPRMALLPLDILFPFNVQHDCVTANCQLTMITGVATQEQIATTLNKATIEHKDHQVFIINMHSLHNTHLICKILPCELVAPVLAFEDRNANQHSAAACARTMGPKKRADAQKKSQQTHKCNRAARTMQATTMSGPPPGPLPENGPAVSADLHHGVGDDDDDDMYL